MGNDANTEKINCRANEKVEKSRVIKYSHGNSG